MVPVTANSDFVRHCTQAKEVLATVRDIIDCKAKRIEADAQSKNALRAVRDEYRRLLSLLRNVGLETATAPDKKTRR